MSIEEREDYRRERRAAGVAGRRSRGGGLGDLNRGGTIGPVMGRDSSARYADVASEKIRNAGQASIPVPSVVGKPMPVFGVLPAGGLEFNFTFEGTLPIDWEYGDGPRNLFTYQCPKGYIAVVKDYQFSYLPSGPDGIITDCLLLMSLTLSGAMDPANKDVRIFPFQPPNKCHIVMDDNDTLSSLSYINTDSSLAFGQKFVVRLSGVYLLPNNQAPKYTELEVGEVKIRNE